MRLGAGCRGMHFEMAEVSPAARPQASFFPPRGGTGRSGDGVAVAHQSPSHRVKLGGEEELATTVLVSVGR
jgi:hypothetical protein